MRNAPRHKMDRFRCQTAGLATHVGTQGFTQGPSVITDNRFCRARVVVNGTGSMHLSDLQRVRENLTTAHGSRIRFPVEPAGKDPPKPDSDSPDIPPVLASKPSADALEDHRDPPGIRLSAQPATTHPCLCATMLTAPEIDRLRLAGVVCGLNPRIRQIPRTGSCRYLRFVDELVVPAVA